MLNGISIDNYYPEFKIIKTYMGFKLISSNLVINNGAYILKTHIEQIDNSNMNQLKKLYKEILKEGLHSKKNQVELV